MGVSSISVDSVPIKTFTPQEPLVELLRICLEKNTVPFLAESHDKPFLVTWLVKEWARKLEEKSRILIIVPSQAKAELWTKFLNRLTLFEAALHTDPKSPSTELQTLIVATPEGLSSLGLDFGLVIVDNGQVLMLNSSVQDFMRYLAIPKGRIVTLTANLFRDAQHEKLLESRSLERLIEKRLTTYNGDPEACNDILSMLRFFCSPTQLVLEHDQSPKPSQQIELEVDKIVQNCYDFFRGHHFSLLEIYGEEFQDLIQDVPDPVELPIKLLDDFVQVKNTLGLWCAERAALLLIIKIDKLKTREKYERHFLLLSSLYTEMVKIRKLCEIAFNDLTDIERLTKHSTPKLLRLVEVLRQYKPDHVCRPKSKVPATTEKIAQEKAESSSSEPNSSSKPRSRTKGGYSSYDDPNALCGVIFVENRFMAKLLYHFLKDLSRSEDAYSFLMPQYATDLEDEHLEAIDVESDRKKQEDSLRRFRMKECNVLISSSLLEIGVDGVRCNLVLAFDPPKSFSQYANYKVKAKASKAHFVIFCSESEQTEVINSLSQFCATEAKLVSYCTIPGIQTGILAKNEDNEEDSDRRMTPNSPFFRLNRYCTKLPSDTFTRLTPLYGVTRSENKYQCKIILPINSPLRDIIMGPFMDNIDEAKHAAALEAITLLRSLGELDEKMMPVGRDAPRLPKVTVTQPTEKQKEEPSSDGTIVARDPKSILNIGRPGTTKRRQYYYKQIAKCLSTKHMDSFHLYSLKMRLTCAIPDEQNTRGRKIHPPESAAHCFGILIQSEMQPICEFPIYTRDGEIFVETQHLEADLQLSPEKKEQVLKFHKFTFSQVLRLEKFPMVFKPDEGNSTILLVPLSNERNLSIDWNYLETIDYDRCAKLDSVPDDVRKARPFKEEDFIDAVVTPWYRNQDQPQYFYVAEICSHLSPRSDFPGQGFDTFEKYYKDKYKICIQHLDQPLLDVDHTSARLNFLTPRYVNRKGIALPTSSEETKRSKRENLEQKQILVPELCTIHPFPASLWRQAVCLPCVLYRLNSLLMADSLRRQVASEMRLGVVDLPKGHKWPPLTFGWTLSDVIQSGASVTSSKQPQHKVVSETVDGDSETPDKSESPILVSGDEELGDLSSKLLNKLNKEESKLRQKSNLEIGTWSNEMAEMEAKAAAAEAAAAAAAAEAEAEEEEDFMEMLDPNIALPDNLTFIDDSVLPQVSTGGSRRDWGTGIAQKKFRVGSPTFFANPDINIPGLMDDLDGFSCSDSDDDDYMSTSRHVIDDNVAEVEEVGEHVRIEFRGRIAEAIEDEEQAINRLATLAKNREEDETMVNDLPWSIDAEEEADQRADPFSITKEWSVVKVDDSFSRSLENAYVGDAKPHSSPVMASLRLPLLSLSADYHLRLNVDLPCGVIPRETDQAYARFSFDLQPLLDNSAGPSPSLLLQALTMSNSNDVINLERLETIGDSFLKFAVTSYLYCAYPSIHEGKLSHLRSKQVSNLNLYRLGREKRLGELMIATKFEPHDNWLPPGYYVPEHFEQALINSGVPSSHWNMADMPDVTKFNCDEISNMIKEKNDSTASGGQEAALEKLPSFVPYNLLTQHSIPDKSIADCVEALIGAYLISCGQKGTLLLMSWLGLTVLPQDDSGKILDLPSPSSPLLNSDEMSLKQLDYLLYGFESFEELIGYRFRDKSYLLQAFSHASYYPNRITDCYQRLEFLGDAVLDYLITRHLYEDERKHSPGTLTDLRSALVNNTIFATLAVKFQFHKYFMHFSPGLHTVVSRFVKIQVENESAAFIDEFFLMGDDDLEEAEDVEVPKALGDIFESVAGAIFLDSGLSLDAVWRVYFRMMQGSIDLYSANVPKSPIREILELEPETAQFGKPEKLADGRRVRCTLEIIGKGVFKGIGRSYRIAKCTAAKCALRALKASPNKS